MAWILINGLVLLTIVFQVEPNALGNITSLTGNAKDFIFISSENGYKAEKHHVTTEDGYILTVFRIPAGSSCAKKTPLLLMHGLLLSAECFVSSGPDAPAFVLARECYDVWVGNVRGNYHSRRHLTLDPDRDLKFWKFSVDEMGMYDIPAMVDYVLNATDTKKLIYIGYSQGSGSFFIMNSERPEYANKISLFIGLAPSTRHYHTKSVVFRTGMTTMRAWQNVLEGAGMWELFSRRWPVQLILNTLCQMELLTELVCDVGLSVLDSPHPDSITPEILRRVVDFEPSGTSVQNMAKYGQALAGKKFSKFSYGSAGNMKVYGSVEPPDYDLGKTTMPSVVFLGKSDRLVDRLDMDWAASQLPNLLEYVIVDDPLWNHFDMAYSRYWKHAIFDRMKKYLDKYDSCFLG